MSDRLRISVRDARAALSTGDAVLVCAYDDEDKCDKNRLDNALTLREFRLRREVLSDREIIFYCG